MGTKLLLLNGPPRSGKDTIGGLLKTLNHRLLLDGVGRIVKEQTHLAYGLDVPFDFFEDRKDESCEEFGGATPRQAYIYYSERVAKPRYGEGYFGTLLGEQLLRSPFDCYVITDSGFAAEARALGNVLAPDRIVVAEIHRPGCDFRNDARSHWWSPSLMKEDNSRGEPWWDQPEHYTWVNSGPLEKLKDRVIVWANQIGLS